MTVKKIKKHNAFTIIELLVAMSLLVILFMASGMVFRMAVDAHRRATAANEITQTLRTLTSQLDNDFKQLIKDAEILLAWSPSVRVDENGNIIDWDQDGNPDFYDRFDRIVFNVNDRFRTYKQYTRLTGGPPENVEGNNARICYMIARQDDQLFDANPAVTPLFQKPAERILGRSQHIYTADMTYTGDHDTSTPDEPYPLDLPDPVNPTSPRLPVANPLDPTAGQWPFNAAFVNQFEYENITYKQWLDIPFDVKIPMLTIITDLTITVTDPSNPSNDITYPPPADAGLTVDPKGTDNIHMILSQGVSSFSIQVWNDQLMRWYPEVDPNGDGNYSDSDITLPDTTADLELEGIYWHPQMGDFETNGLGKALKFTFRLNDSRGVFPEGKAFTHIVYLNE